MHTGELFSTLLLLFLFFFFPFFPSVLTVNIPLETNDSRVFRRRLEIDGNNILHSITITMVFFSFFLQNNEKSVAFDLNVIDNWGNSF